MKFFKSKKNKDKSKTKKNKNQKKTLDSLEQETQTVEQLDNNTLDEVKKLKEHMTIVLSYVKNLENNVNGVDKNQNIMGQDISKITNMLLGKINMESSKIDDHKNNMEILLTEKTDMLLNEINTKTKELDDTQNNMGENISKITNMLSSRINVETSKLQEDIKTVLVYLKSIENKNKNSDNSVNLIKRLI